MNIFNNKSNMNKLKLASYAIIFIMYGFDVRTYIGGIIPINMITSILILLILPIFLLVVVDSKSRNQNIKVRYLDSLILIFFVIYGLRLFINLYIEEIEQNLFNNNLTCFVYLIFLCVIPYVILRNLKWNNIDMGGVLKTLIFLYLLGLVFSFKTILTDLASGIIYYQGRADANEFLDTIGYGHLALSFMLACYSYNSVRGMNKWVFMCLVLFGLLSMGLANSRSPFLALFIILGINLFEHIRISHIILVLFSFFLIYQNLDTIDIFFKENFNSPVIERTMMVFDVGMEDASTGRDSLFDDGILQFMESPIWGSSIVLTSGEYKGAYVHNSIIEVLMGVGLIGFCFYALLNIVALKCAITLIRRNSQFKFFAYILIQYSVFLLVSRSLLLLPLYWSSIACVYTCALVEKNKCKTNI